MGATGGLGAFGIFSAAFGISSAVQLPFFFALGFTRARPFAFIAPMAAAALVIVVVGRDQSLLAWVASNLGSWPLLAALATVGSVTFVGSAMLSVRLYTSREL